MWKEKTKYCGSGGGGWAPLLKERGGGWGWEVSPRQGQGSSSPSICIYIYYICLSLSHVRICSAIYCCASVCSRIKAICYPITMKLIVLRIGMWLVPSPPLLMYSYMYIHILMNPVCTNLTPLCNDLYHLWFGSDVQHIVVWGWLGRPNSESKGGDVGFSPWKGQN